MKTEKIFAEMLIEQYRSVIFGHCMSKHMAIQCAINDVTNTIEALIEQYKEIWGKNKDWKFTEHTRYYNNVLNILKEKV